MTPKRSHSVPDQRAQRDRFTPCGERQTDTRRRCVINITQTQSAPADHCHPARVDTQPRNRIKINRPQRAPVNANRARAGKGAGSRIERSSSDTRVSSIAV